MPSSKLEAHYNKLEAQWTLTDVSTDYGRLVVATDNTEDPLHRWFHLKEAFSSRLLARLFKDASWTPNREVSVLDPFVGSGTTLLSALSIAEKYQLPARIAGIERNPVIQIVAAAKTTAALRGSSLAPRLAEASKAVLAEFDGLGEQREPYTTPSPTLNNEDYFPPQHVQSLIALRHAVNKIEDSETRQILQTCLASAVEPAGRLRRDGRALRHVPDRTPAHPRDLFYSNVERCLEDLRARPTAPEDWTATVLPGDARNASSLYEGQEFDWIVFSPPYPNNIDYTEVYKTEAWALGCYEDADAMRSQRLSTIRSHPSIRFPSVYWYTKSGQTTKFESLVNPILDAIPSEARYKNGRTQVIRGYADDMFRVLVEARSLINGDGYCAFIVGNSVHGTGDNQFVIAADLIMAELATMAGWRVDEIRVARWLARRGNKNHHLRESVVCLRPAG